MASTDALFQPLTIRNCTIRNRVMSTSHAPSYGKDGMPQQRYQLYHEEKAKGGIGLTSVGGSSSVAPDSPAALWNQLDIGEDKVIPFLQEFSARVHRHGAKIFCQITHMGRRTRWDAENWMATIAPSPLREPSHRSFPKEMEEWDIRRVQKDYAAAALRLKEGGFDGVEILADSHLPGQFWSPHVNRRTDAYGGSTENRSRFTLELFEQVRKVIGDDMVFGIRMSGDELLDDGITPEEAIRLARIHVGQGCIDYLNINCSHVYTERGLANLIPNMSMPVAPYLALASLIKREIGTVPVFHAGRIPDVNTAARAIEEGHVDMVAMTRAHIADPHIVNKLREGRADDIRQCVGAGYCIDRIYVGGDAICIQNPATGREATLPHIVPKGQGGKKVVVVGGGPAGMEAARVSAERGNSVVLFEKSPALGGQITLAGKADWREGLNGITRWLQGQLRRLGIEVRLATEATAEAVQAENPDLVVIATGGHPNLNEVKAAPGHVVSTWDILNGKVAPGENVLLFDDHADHHGPSVASFMAKRGSRVEVVTPERKLMVEVGMTNFPHYLRDLYKMRVVITPDTKLTEVYPEGNKLVAVLVNEYTDEEEERVVDQVVIEHGTLPDDHLYFSLKPFSKNLGEVDMRKLRDRQPQDVVNNPEGRFMLFRVGDAVACRNIHAALYDSLRLCLTF
jgi:2,4-dienoyl-CoA reductase-like NADH-dependent reductase (Old Yellow Enzyme family)/thioredoxin reductase